MSEKILPKEVINLINEHINSVFQLEILLLLHQHRRKEWSAETLSREFGLDRNVAATQIADLHSRGFLTERTDDGLLYQYSPASSELERAVDGLASAYAVRRMTVISSIFSKPVKKITLFADAFKIRKNAQDD